MALWGKKHVRNYKIYNENGQVLELSNCIKCDSETPIKNALCFQCKNDSRKYKPETYQKRRHKILEVFYPVDNSPLVRPKNKV